VLGLTVPGQPPTGPADGSVGAMAPAVADSPGDSLPDGWSMGEGGDWDCGDWDCGDWDLAGCLTAREVAALAALDRAGDPVDDWHDDPGAAAPADVEALLARTRPRLPDDEPCVGPAEALPGLMPRHLGTGAGFDAGGAVDRVPPPTATSTTAGGPSRCLAQASAGPGAAGSCGWRPR
jgi:hypothetical protein